MDRQRAMTFERWAEQHGLVPHGHDAAYAGAMSGVRVAIESGVRDTGLYDVVVTNDDAQVVVRYWHDVALEEIAEAVRQIAEAWRTLAPYR